MGNAANERKRQRKQAQKKWKPDAPIATVEQAVDFLLSHLDCDTVEWLKAQPAETDLSGEHREFEMFIRNTFGLWRDNTALLRDCGDENMFPDKASTVILAALIQRLKNE